MRTHVHFRSTKFPPYPGEEGQINPGVWGKRLAEYLVAKLAERGIETDAIIPEDWGWYIPIPNGKFALGLCCGHQDGDADEFICFTEPSTPFVKKLFWKIDATQEIKLITGLLQQILESDPDIREITWNEPE